MAAPVRSGGVARPDVSFIMPCYNEEASVTHVAGRLVDAFEKAGHRFQLIAVDNGSSDRTGELIRELAETNRSVVFCRVDVNQGYGHGVLCGLRLATAPWVGIIPADGQVDPEDVVHLYEAAAATDGRVLAKVRRRFRMDGVRRKLVSLGYNVFVRVLWPGLGTIDVNGSPKILPREVFSQLQLKSKGWFLDPEMVIKAHYLGVRVLEYNVFARMRGNGLSHVRFSACLEFFSRLLALRFGRELSQWAQSVEAARRESAPTSDVHAKARAQTH